MSSATADLKAYDRLPSELRVVVAASHHPVSCRAIEQVLAVGGFERAIRHLRELEKLHVTWHEKVVARACRR